MISQLLLNASEVHQIEQLLADVTRQYSSPEDPAFLHEAIVISHELPLRTRQFLNTFRLSEPKDAVVCVISGYPIDHKKIGLTPLGRGEKSDTNRTLNEQMLLVLLASLLGDPVAWSTQQAGHIIHDVSPVPGQENDQTGSSSETELMFHTEDAFHPYRGDYLGMMCLRNENKTATSIASNHALSMLTEKQIHKLFQPCVFIRPDASQYEKHTFPKIAGLDEEVVTEFIHYSDEKIKEMDESPEAIPVLFGDRRSPYMRVDCPAYMDALDDETEDAVNALGRAFEMEQKDLTMKAGDICFIDNLRSVHGRKPFKASYDGNDRWLKRVNISRDIRKSRDMRITDTSRIIF
jgi:Fe(II)/alpha-ketoglutarate-dependent arginine beta-hydroxylase